LGMTHPKATNMALTNSQDWSWNEMGKLGWSVRCETENYPILHWLYYLHWLDHHLLILFEKI
jgi:hypothetical protein